jgi:hypothetical protein
MSIRNPFFISQSKGVVVRGKAEGGRGNGMKAGQANDTPDVCGFSEDAPPLVPMLRERQMPTIHVLIAAGYR